MPGFCQLAPVREYTVNKVKATPPKIDGEWSEDEWAGSEWTGKFYGLRYPDVPTDFWGQVADINIRWRALWDDDYLYVLIVSDFKYLNPNGWTYAGDMVAVLEADDTGYAGWGIGTCVDFEMFIEPNWKEGDGANDMETNSPAYQLCYFPIKEDDQWAPSNFGVRGAEGPPYFYTGNAGGPARIAGAWNPITDPAEAKLAGVKPLQLAALPHEIPGAVEGKDVVAVPALEVALPYSQFGLAALPDVAAIEDVDEMALNLIMVPDAAGKYVKPGDEWLFNVCAYTDNATAATGLSLITWNDMGEGGFHNYPRGILKFAEAVRVSEWMVH